MKILISALGIFLGITFVVAIFLTFTLELLFSYSPKEPGIIAIMAVSGTLGLSVSLVYAAVKMVNKELQKP